MVSPIQKFFELSDNSRILKDTMWPKKREHKRHKIDLPVKIKLKSYDDFITQYITDISAGGLFIATPTPYEIGNLIDIEFYLEDEQKHFFKVRGRVVRLHDSPNGMGIQFTEIEEESQALIDQLMAKRDSQSNH